MEMNKENPRVITTARAWKLSHFEFDILYPGGAPIVYSDTYEEAVERMIEQIEDNYKTTANRLLEPSDVKVSRYLPLDRLNFRGINNIERQNAAQILKQERHTKQLFDLMGNPAVTHCYIMKRGVYYRDNFCGYTDSIAKAGVYLKYNAVNHAVGNTEISVVPVDPAFHNNLINQQIAELKKRLIKTE